MYKLSEEDLLIIGKKCLKDNSIISLFEFYEWQLNNVKEDRNEVYKQKLVHLYASYDEVLNKIQEKLNEMKCIIIGYAVFALENKHVEITN